MQRAPTIRGLISTVLASTLVVFVFAMGLHRGHLRPIAAEAPAAAHSTLAHAHHGGGHDAHNVPASPQKQQIGGPHCPLCRLASGLALPPPDLSLTVPVVFVAWIVPIPTELPPPRPHNVAARPRGPPTAA